MPTRRRFDAWPAVVVAMLLIAACSRRGAPEYQAPAGISWSSVLRGHDLASLAQPVPAWAASRHFSSASHPGKVSLAAEAPQIFGDMDHGFFQKVEALDGGLEATLAEVNGSGMITWVWSAKPIGTLRLYLDDPNQPALEMPFRDFMQGDFLPDAGPFAARTSSGYNLHIPLIHRTFARVVVRASRREDLAMLYYQIAWNALPADAVVHPFDRADIQRGGTVLRAIGREWEDRARDRGAEPEQTVTIPAGATATLLASEAPGEVREIVLQAERKSALADLWFTASWDGETQPAVDAPLHLLAGVSRDCEDVKSLLATVRGARVVLRWPMPFARATIRLRNAGREVLTLRYALAIQPPRGTLRFCAVHTRRADIPTDGTTILPLASMTGSGRIAGCCVHVDSRTKRWWGEGDQHIYLDTILEPTWRGTGTEDYFGLAWCDRSLSAHPLHGQSVARDAGEGRLTAMHRVHLLDQLPFHHHARFDTEAWGLAAGRMNYEALVLCYREAGAGVSSTR